MDSQLDLFGGSCGSKCQPSLTPETMHSAVSWADWSERTPPSSVHTNKDAGRVQVWLPDPRAGSLGAFSTVDIGDSHSRAHECSLSAVLETGPIPRQYYLSAKAARGIIHRMRKKIDKDDPNSPRALDPKRLPPWKLWSDLCLAISLAETPRSPLMDTLEPYLRDLGR